jgi:hypothetical protein
MASTAKLEQSENSVASAKLHVGHLLRFLEKEYKDTRLQYDRMTREGTSSWSMLWAFLPPGEKVYYNCQFSGQQVCGNVRLRHYYKHHVTGSKRLHVELDVMVRATVLTTSEPRNSRVPKRAILQFSQRVSLALRQAARANGSCISRQREALL